MTDKEKTKTTIRSSPVKAIRGKCNDCMNSYRDGRRDCGVVNCTLYPWMPYGSAPKREPSAAQIEAGKRLAAILKARKEANK